MNKTKKYIDVELGCLCLKSFEDLKNVCQGLGVSIQSILQTLLDQNYVECLEKCLDVHNIFHSLALLKTLPNNLHEIKSKDWNNEERKLWLYACAISCLQLFVQANWTGPTRKIDEAQVAFEAQAFLCVDGQPVYHLVQSAHYLFAAKVLFSYFLQDSDFQTAAWWLFRCHCIHAQILLQRTDSLFEETKEVLELVSSSPLFKEERNRSLLFQFHLEAGLVLLHYYDYKRADGHFEHARELCGVEFGFTGALGVRTKFQQKAVSQLQVSVKRNTDDPLESTVSRKPDESLPNNFSLNDDTLLEKVKLLDENEITNPKLIAEEYCMILAACTAMQKTDPSHRIKQEKLQAVIEFLLDAPSCWCVQAEVLRLRCLNEKDRSRTVERSMMQLENLVALVTTSKPTTISRLDLFFSVRLPPVWVLQKDLAKLYTSLGATSSAHQIYVKLEMWEDAILCLIRSDRADEAMKLIDEQLKLKETPNLLCLLGDITQEPKHYETAWEISNHKSTRAMTSLGCYYISMKNFEKSVECFEKSLAILSLQVHTWFTMGCALLRLEDYEKAADAFRRCVSLDWDNYEAWTNLSTSYVRCGKKKQAYKALSEAIKCNFDKWQLWENYLAVCCDVGHFNEAITAYNRLLDLKKKYIDVAVLKIFVRIVNENIADANGLSGSLLKPKIMTLFGHVTSQTTGNSRVWDLYSELCGDGVGADMIDNEKAIQFLHKALRTGMQATGWEKNDEDVERLKVLGEKLRNACRHSSSDLSTQTISSVRLTVNGFLIKLKQREKSLVEETAQEGVRKHINDVEVSLQAINQVLSETKQS